MRRESRYIGVDARIVVTSYVSMCWMTSSSESMPAENVQQKQKHDDVLNVLADVLERVDACRKRATNTKAR